MNGEWVAPNSSDLTTPSEVACDHLWVSLDPLFENHCFQTNDQYKR